MDLIEELIKGQPRAIARSISLVENEDAGAQDLMKAIFPFTGGARVIGITGAPGTGKSTLVDQLARLYKKKKKKLGIIAVDPSSPFSGGAILGDRIRMMRHSTDRDIFIRSMATRGYLGGVAKSTGETIAVLEAAGKDIVLVETVGVGQDEVDVVKFSDFILVVLNPGSGDEIQAFKAGIMEIADIFVLNKADSPECDKAERHLQSMLELGGRPGVCPPVIKTIAPKGEGVDLVWKELERLQSGMDPETRRERKRKLIGRMLQDIIARKAYQKMTASISKAEMEGLIEKIDRRETDPYTVAERIIAKWEEC